MRKSMGQNTEPLLLKTLEGIDEPGMHRVAAATAQLVLRAFLAHPKADWGLRILLHGDLGAGKTTWVRAFLRTVGITGRIKSPSFSVVESYQTSQEAGDLAIHHLDFYRQSNPKAWQAGGLRDLMAERAVILVEWPERAEGLPYPDIEIWLSWSGEILGDGPRDLRIAFHNTPAGSQLAPWLDTWIADVDTRS